MKEEEDKNFYSDVCARLFSILHIRPLVRYLLLFVIAVTFLLTQGHLIYFMLNASALVFRVCIFMF